MARRPTYLFYWETPDEREWEISFLYYRGRPGSYEDPPENPEVEFQGVVEQLLPGVLGPPQRFASFDDFCQLHNVSDADVLRMEERAYEAVEDDYIDVPEPEEPYEAY